MKMIENVLKNTGTGPDDFSIPRVFIDQYIGSLFLTTENIEPRPFDKVDV